MRSDHAGDLKVKVRALANLCDLLDWKLICLSSRYDCFNTVPILQRQINRSLEIGLWISHTQFPAGADTPLISTIGENRFANFGIREWLQF